VLPGREFLKRASENHAMVIVDSPVKYHLAKNGQVSGGPEQSGMASNSSHGKSVLVMNFTSEQSFSPRIALSGRYFGF
jgi:hypothetical protein